MIRRATQGVLASAAALALLAPSASATASRAEYVALVDPICQDGRSREKDVIRSFKKQVERLKERGVDVEEPTKRTVRIGVNFFDRLVRIERSVDYRISAVKPALGDEAIVSQWLERRDMATDLFQRAVRAFARGKEQYSSQLLTRSADVGFRSKFLIEDFGFKSCVEIDPGP